MVLEDLLFPEDLLLVNEDLFCDFSESVDLVLLDLSLSEFDLEELDSRLTSFLCSQYWESMLCAKMLS